MQSEQIDELTKALLGAQAEFPVILKTKTAKIPTKSGGQYSYNYADLADINVAVNPILHNHGLVITQSPSITADGKPSLVTKLLHVSGQWIDSEMLLHIASSDAQGQGSAITYARRYAKSAILDIVTETDDDGALATENRREEAQRRPQQGAEPVRRAAPQRPAPSPVDNEDIQFIIDAAAISDNQMLIDLAAKYKQYGMLTERQLAAGVPQAMKSLTESKKSQHTEVPNEDGEYQW